MALRDRIADAWIAGGWHSNMLEPVTKPQHDNIAWVRENKPFALSFAFRIADFVISLQSEMDRDAVRTGLEMLADAVDDGNEHNFPDMSAKELRALAERLAA